MATTETEALAAATIGELERLLDAGGGETADVAALDGGRVRLRTVSGASGRAVGVLAWRPDLRGDMHAGPMLIEHLGQTEQLANLGELLSAA